MVPGQSGTKVSAPFHFESANWKLAVRGQPMIGQSSEDPFFHRTA
jgi:hypothetical protein